MRTMWLAALALGAWSGAADAAAVKIFKYADAEGRVTYTNREPAPPIAYTTLEVEVDGPQAAPPSAPVLAEPRKRTRKVRAREKPEPQARLVRVGGLRAAPLRLRLDARLSLDPR